MYFLCWSRQFDCAKKPLVVTVNRQGFLYVRKRLTIFEQNLLG